MTRGRSVSLEKVELICKLYREGKSTSEVARIVDAHPNTVSKILTRAGVERRPAKHYYRPRHHMKPAPVVKEVKIVKPVVPRALLPLAMSRNGQRYAPLRLPPLRVEGK